MLPYNFIDYTGDQVKNLRGGTSDGDRHLFR